MSGEKTIVLVSTDADVELTVDLDATETEFLRSLFARINAQADCMCAPAIHFQEDIA